MKSAHESRNSLDYLVKQAILILLLAYLVLAGGTLNGLLRFHLHVISHILSALVLGIWLGTALWQRRKIARPGLEWAILFVFAIQIVTTLLSSDLRRSLGWLGMMVLYGLVFYLVYDLSRHGWPATLTVKSLLIVGGIVIAWGVVDILAWYLNWLSQSGGRIIPTQPLRLYTLLGDANMLSGFLNLLLPLALIRFVNTRRSLSRLILLGWLAGNLLVQFFTSSRGGWLGTIAVFVTLVVLIAAAFGGWRDRLILWWRVGRRRKWLLFPAGAVVCLLVLGIAVLGWYQLNHPTHGGIWEARRVFWQTAWQAFVSSPWYGTGPFTFSTQLLKYQHFLDRPYPHAHSLPITVLAEGGLLGVLSLAVLIVCLVRRLWLTWCGASFEQRLFMSGGLASLAGFCVHSLVDNHLLAPTIGLLVVVIAAMTLAKDTAPAENEQDLLHGIHPLWFVLPAVFLVGGSGWSDRAYYPFWQAVQLTQRGEWQQAAPLFDLAVERDEGFPFYHLQQGYTWGVLATQMDAASTADMETALANAIAAYERGVTLEPYYSLNHANLSALYWQAEEKDRAVAEMQRAIEQTPDVVPYYLNLARYAEDMGQWDDAITNYQQVLDMRPDLADAGHYWQSTPVKQAALASWNAAHAPKPVPDSPASYADYLQVGWDAFDREDWTSAQDAFLQARAISPASLAAYNGLARANIALGDYIRAESFARKGLSIFTQGVGDKLDLLLTYGEVAYRQGRLKDAIKRYETALGMVEQPTIYGRGTIGWSPYGWFVFQRESIQPDMLPQLERLEMTDSTAARLVDLAHWYEEAGQPDKAVETYRRILALVPDFEPALEGSSGID